MQRLSGTHACDVAKVRLCGTHACDVAKLRLCGTHACDVAKPPRSGLATTAVDSMTTRRQTWLQVLSGGPREGRDEGPAGGGRDKNAMANARTLVYDLKTVRTAKDTTK